MLEFLEKGNLEIKVGEELSENDNITMRLVVYPLKKKVKLSL